MSANMLILSNINKKLRELRRTVRLWEVGKILLREIDYEPEFLDLTSEKIGELKTRGVELRNQIKSLLDSLSAS